MRLADGPLDGAPATALAVDGVGLLDARDQVDVEAHVDACPRCTRAVAYARTLRAALERAGPGEAPAPPPGQLERIVAALRAGAPSTRTPALPQIRTESSPGPSAAEMHPARIRGRPGAGDAVDVWDETPRRTSRARRDEPADVLLRRLTSSRIGQGSFDQYLRDISEHPELTPDEEARLARRIRAGDQEALDELVRSNLRFVVAVAERYLDRGIALSDLVNEGNLGLIRAAHRFGEIAGVRFSSYAVFWIRGAIVEALAEQRRILGDVPGRRVAAPAAPGNRVADLLHDGRGGERDESSD